MAKVPVPTDLMASLSNMSAAEVMGTVKGAALFEGDFAWLFWVCLVGYCAGNCAAVLNASPKIRFVHGLVLLTLNSYGGSTIAAIICGQPVPFMVNEKLIVGLVGTWVVCFILPGLPKMIKGAPRPPRRPARCLATFPSATLSHASARTPPVMPPATPPAAPHRAPHPMPHPARQARRSARCSSRSASRRCAAT